MSDPRRVRRFQEKGLLETANKYGFDPYEQSSQNPEPFNFSCKSSDVVDSLLPESIVDKRMAAIFNVVSELSKKMLVYSPGYVATELSGRFPESRENISETEKVMALLVKEGSLYTLSEPIIRKNRVVSFECYYPTDSGVLKYC